MKLSRYVSCIPIADHTLIFNAMNKQCVIAHHMLITRTELETANEGISELYSQLCDIEAYLPDDVDEVSDLIERIEVSETSPLEFTLHINPTMDCNFRCWYCYENHVTGSKMNMKTLDNVKQFITAIASNTALEVLHLGFFGGEPLMYFNDVALKLIIHTADVCKKANVKLMVSFTSNAGLLTDDVIKFLSQYDCSFQITLDGGKISHDKIRFFKGGKGSYDLIIRNVKKLLQVGIHVTLRVNYDANNVTTLQRLIEDIQDIPEMDRQIMVLDFQRVWQDRKDRYDAVETQISDIRKLCASKGFRMATNYILKDATHLCYADRKNYAMINYDGNVFGCTARDFKVDNAIGKLEENGMIVYDEKRKTARDNSKFSKEICHTCRIAPLCGGGCKQRSLESIDTNTCTFGYSEEDKDRIIKDLIEYLYISQNQ